MRRVPKRFHGVYTSSTTPRPHAEMAVRAPTPGSACVRRRTTRTHAPGTQRNETTALAPPSGLRPDRRLPARSQWSCVCVPRCLSVPRPYPRDLARIIWSRHVDISPLASRGVRSKGARAVRDSQDTRAAHALAHAPAPWSGAALGVSSAVSYRPQESLAAPTGRSNGGGGLLSTWDPCSSSTAPPVASFAGLRAALGC